MTETPIYDLVTSMLREREIQEYDRPVAIDSWLDSSVTVEGGWAGSAMPAHPIGRHRA